ncbi:hypothetical protein [Amycolatopsis sp. DSM 110486]|uniref:hypothetical protein n=1 Tax=Amycolatopsis sp. DSM 110486 TaxID=2865832 RepID=UPI001C697567|nr:hypothetical protein [Amycolatopsis sp. DSM 110486]QYN16811.1 hypothetical protein K1T34_28585 [Amycolatopsis sp. DSM 110486]
MGLFGRSGRDGADGADGDGGYEDNAALTGVGGYEPADAPGFPAAGYGTGSPVSGKSAAEPAAEPGRGPWPAQGEKPGGTPWYAEDPAATGHAPRAEPQRIRPPSRPPARLKGRPSRALWILVAVIALGVAAMNFFGAARHHSASPSTPSQGPVTFQPEPHLVVPAVVDGWSSVAARDGSFAYDVPPSWTPEPGVVHGWDGTATSPGITLGTTASVGRGYCGSDSRHGGSGVTTEDGGNAEAAARKAVGDLVGSAYDPGAKVTYAPAQDATVQLEGLTRPARVVLADVTQGGTDACTQKHVTVAALALATATQSVVLVVYTDDTTSRADVVRLLQSYRGVPAADRTTTTPPPTTR